MSTATAASEIAPPPHPRDELKSLALEADQFYASDDYKNADAPTRQKYLERTAEVFDEAFKSAESSLDAAEADSFYNSTTAFLQGKMAEHNSRDADEKRRRAAADKSIQVFTERQKVTPEQVSGVVKRSLEVAGGMSAQARGSGVMKLDGEQGKASIGVQPLDWTPSAEEFWKDRYDLTASEAEKKSAKDFARSKGKDSLADDLLYRSAVAGEESAKLAARDIAFSKGADAAGVAAAEQEATSAYRRNAKLAALESTQSSERNPKGRKLPFRVVRTNGMLNIEPEEGKAEEAMMAAERMGLLTSEEAARLIPSGVEMDKEFASRPKAQGGLVTAVKEFGSAILPALGTAAGTAIGAAASKGDVSTAMVGGASGGSAALWLQNKVFGQVDQAQREANARAHPGWAQVGSFVPFLVSMFQKTPPALTTVGKMAQAAKVSLEPGTAAARWESALQSGVAMGRAGFSSGVQQRYVEGNKDVNPIDEGVRSFIAGGAMGILKPAKGILMAMTGKAVKDAAAVTFAEGLYDLAVHNKPIDFKAIADEAPGTFTAFALQNAVMGVFHKFQHRREMAKMAGKSAAAANTAAAEAAEAQAKRFRKDGFIESAIASESLAETHRRAAKQDEKAATEQYWKDVAKADEAAPQKLPKPPESSVPAPHPVIVMIDSAVAAHANELAALGHPSQLTLVTMPEGDTGLRYNPNTGRIEYDPVALEHQAARMAPRQRAEWIKRAVSEEVFHAATDKYASESPENRAKLYDILKDKDAVTRAEEAYGKEAFDGLDTNQKAFEVARVLLQGPRGLTEAAYRFFKGLLRWLDQKLKNLSPDTKELLDGIKTKLEAHESGKVKEAKTARVSDDEMSRRRTPLSQKDRRSLQDRAEEAVARITGPGRAHAERRLESIARDHQQIRREYADAKTVGEKLRLEIEMVETENAWRKITGEAEIDIHHAVTAEDIKKDAERLYRRAQEIKAKLKNGEAITPQDRQDWKNAGMKPEELPKETKTGESPAKPALKSAEHTQANEGPLTERAAYGRTGDVYDAFGNVQRKVGEPKNEKAQSVPSVQKADEPVRLPQKEVAPAAPSPEPVTPAAAKPVEQPAPAAAPAPQAPAPVAAPVPLLPKPVIQALLRSGHEIVPSGPQQAGFRSLVMEKIGKPVPKSKAGVTAVTKALAEYLGVDMNDTIAGVESKMRAKLKDMLATHEAPAPAPAPSPAAVPAEPTREEKLRQQALREVERQKASPAAPQAEGGIFGYSWADIRGKQQGGTLAALIRGNAPKATESDFAVLEKHGMDWLYDNKKFGIIDRLGLPAERPSKKAVEPKPPAQSFTEKVRAKIVPGAKVSVQLVRGAKLAHPAIVGDVFLDSKGKPESVRVTFDGGKKKGITQTVPYGNVSLRPGVESRMLTNEQFEGMTKEEARKTRAAAAEFKKLVIEYPELGFYSGHLEAVAAGPQGEAAIKKARADAYVEAMMALGVHPNKADARDAVTQASLVEKMRELTKKPGMERKQYADFQEAKEEGDGEIKAGDLKYGETINIGGEEMRVTDIDKDGVVTLQDGEKFGTQEVHPDESLMIKGEAPEPVASKPTTYINGDKAEYTGEMREIAGGTFYVVKFLEGDREGTEGVTQRRPDGTSPDDGRAQAEWQRQQADARKIAAAEELARAKVHLSNLENRMTYDRKRGITNPEDAKRRGELQQRITELEKPPEPATPKLRPEQVRERFNEEYVRGVRPIAENRLSQSPEIRERYEQILGEKLTDKQIVDTAIEAMQIVRESGQPVLIDDVLSAPAHQLLEKAWNTVKSKDSQFAPKLRPSDGNGTGELLQGEAAPFNLVAETAADITKREEREAAEQVAKEAKDAAEAKAKQDKEQGNLFDEDPFAIADTAPATSLPVASVQRAVRVVAERLAGAMPHEVIADGSQYPERLKYAMRQLMAAKKWKEINALRRAEILKEEGIPKEYASYAWSGLPESVKDALIERQSPPTTEDMNRLRGAVSEGKIYINAAAIEKPREAIEVFMHEAAGHGGVDALLQAFGEKATTQLDAMLKRLFEAEHAAVKRRYEPQDQVRETLAMIMEGVGPEMSAQHRTRWQRVVDWLRNALNKLGVKQWSTNDVMALLRRGVDAVRKQRAVTPDAGAARMSYAGEKAQVPQFMRDSLDTAKAMSAAGKTSEEIRAVTGWFPGKYDGKMRWEVPDEGATIRLDDFRQRRKDGESAEDIARGFYQKKHDAELVQAEKEAEGLPVSKLMALSEKLEASKKDDNKGLHEFYWPGENREKGRVPLSYLLDHPELYAAYPEAKWIPVSFRADEVGMDALAQWNPSSGVIGLNPISAYESGEGAKSSLLHEVQHWIQEREKFASGSSPSKFSKDNVNMMVASESLAKDYRDALAISNRVGGFTNEKVTSLPENEQTVALRAWNSVDESWMSTDQIKSEIARLEKRVESLAADFDGSQSYRRTAGEIESRDVQARQNFTPEQRKATEPYSSENIAKEDAIVMRGDGPKMSVGKPQYEIEQGLSIVSDEDTGNLRFRSGAESMGARQGDVSDRTGGGSESPEAEQAGSRRAKPDYRKDRQTWRARPIGVDSFATASDYIQWVQGGRLIDRAGNPIRPDTSDIRFSLKDENPEATSTTKKAVMDKEREVAMLQGSADKLLQDIRKSGRPPTVEEMQQIAAIDSLIAKRQAEIQAEASKVAQGATPPEINIADLNAEPPDREETGESGPRTYGGKFDSMDAQRAERGLPPLARRFRKANRVLWDAAVKRFETEPKWADRLVDEISSGEKTVLTDEEFAGVFAQQIDLHNKRQEAADRARDPNLSEEEQRDALDQFQYYEKKLQASEILKGMAGSEAGAALQSLKLMANEDFSLAAMEARERKAKQSGLTPEEVDRIRDEATRIAKAQADLDARKAATEAAERIANAEAKIAEWSKIPSRVLEYAKQKVNEWVSAGNAASERLRARAGQANVGVDPTILGDIFLFARGKIAQGMESFGNFAASTASEFGEWVSPYLKPAWDKAMKYLNTNQPGRKVSSKQKARQQAATEDAASIEDGILAMAEEGLPDDMGRYVKQLANEYVKSGATTVKGVMARLHAFLDPVMGNPTDDVLLDLWTDYGKGKAATEDALKRLQSQIRQEALIVRQIIDAEAALVRSQAGEDVGDYLKLTGQQRVPVRDQARALAQQLNELKKKIPPPQSTAESRRQSALDALEKRTRNRIKDLRFEIAKGERTIKNRGVTPTSPNLEALRAELATVEAEHLAVFGRREATPEQNLKSAIKSAERAEQKALAELEAAKRGVFTRPVQKGAETRNEVLVIRARADAARAETQALKELASPPLSDAQKRLDAALVARERWEQMLAGEQQPTIRQPQESLTQLEEDARMEIAAMRELAAQIRRDAKPATDPDDAKVRALEAAAAEYERRVNESDFTAKSKTTTADSARVAQARALRDAALAAYNAAKNAAGVTEQTKIANRKAAMLRQIADLTDRLAKSDFEKRPPRPPVDLSKDSEAVRIASDLQEIKSNYAKRLLHYIKERRGGYEKFTDALWTAFTAERSLMGSGDLSAPRQAVRMVKAHPIMAAKAMWRSIRTIFSQKQAVSYEAERKLRPNYALYKPMKIQMPSVEAEAHDRMSEEGVRSNIEDWADIKLSGNPLLVLPKLVPKLLGHYVRASSRTFTTFLNELAADVADYRINELRDKPMSKIEKEALGDMINSARGRGLKAGAGKLAQFVFYSANFLAARAKNLSGYHVWRRNSSMRIRKIAFKEQFRAIAGWMVVSAISRYFYGDTGDDEDILDKAKRLFKLRVTDSDARMEYDYTGGEAKLVRIGAALIEGISTTIQAMLSGQEEADKQRAFTSYATIGREIRSISAPWMGVVTDLYTGSNYDGKVPTVPSIARDLTVPLAWRSADEFFERAGFAKTVVAKLQESIGVGVSVTRDKPTPKERRYSR